MPASQSLVEPFGLTIEDDGYTGSLYATPIATPNPITNGPFGDVSRIDLYGAGIFTDLGPDATALALEDLTGEPVLAIIGEHALGPTSGRVVIFSDSHMFVDTAMGGFFYDQVALFQNTMLYLAPVPEPGTLLLAAIAAGALGACTLGRKAAK